MNAAEPFVYRPTAKSVMRSLAATNKRHIFITGTRGAGKSTLFGALQRQLQGAQIITGANPGENVVLCRETESVTIGVFDPALGGRENKMRPVEEGMARGAQIVTDLACGDTDWVCVDEIGYLETEPYQQAVLELLGKKRVLAVVRKQDTEFLSGLLAREDAFVVDLDQGETGCVIMASGLGRRFGGNKLMAPLGGKPVIAWALDAVKDVFSKVVVVTRHEDVAALCENRGVQTVLHDLPHRSDTVRLGLQALGDVSSCCFLPGDQPFVMKESLYALCLGAKNQDAIWRLGGASPVLFPSWAFPELLCLPEGKGGGVVVKKYPDQVRDLAETSPWELRDIDTPQDLACFCAGICCN